MGCGERRDRQFFVPRPLSSAPRTRRAAPRAHAPPERNISPYQDDLSCNRRGEGWLGRARARPVDPSMLGYWMFSGSLYTHNSYAPIACVKIPESQVRAERVPHSVHTISLHLAAGRILNLRGEGCARARRSAAFSTGGAQAGNSNWTSRLSAEMRRLRPIAVLRSYIHTCRPLHATDRPCRFSTALSMRHAPLGSTQALLATPSRATRLHTARVVCNVVCNAATSYYSRGRAACACCIRSPPLAHPRSHP